MHHQTIHIQPQDHKLALLYQLLQPLYYLYYMILMSEKMMSHTIAVEFITRKTNITL
jgi:hypothetical protein